ncbi:hypothetical protein D3C87_1444470 [compost metagenome]
MIVATWFTIVFIIILIGFTLVGLTFRHWWKESKKAKLQALADKQALTTAN